MPASAVLDALLAMLSSAIQTVTAERDARARSADAAVVAQCEAGLEDYQDAMDAIVTIGAFGVSEILPEPVFRIDMGEIQDGNPFGGDNSFVRKQLGIKW